MAPLPFYCPFGGDALPKKVEHFMFAAEKIAYVKRICYLRRAGLCSAIGVCRRASFREKTILSVS